MPKVNVEGTPTVMADNQNDSNVSDSHWQIPIRRVPTRLSDIDEETYAGQSESIEDLTADLNDDSSWEEISTPTSETAEPVTESKGEAREESEEVAEEVVEEVVRPDLDISLFDAIVRKDLEVVKTILENGVHLERTTEDDYTALVIAILERQVDITKLLLEKGADVNHRVRTIPPIVHAIRPEERAPKLIQLLIDHGASLTTVSGPENMNVLHWAAVEGKLDALNFLISKDLDVNRACSNGRTPLILAAEKGWIACVKVLLAKGAELHKRSENGGTALIWAACNGHLEVVKYLVEQGIDVNDTDDYGLTPLSTACNLGRLEVVKWLVEKGADVNKLSIDPKNFSPAMAAAIAGHTEVLEVLISHGADLTIPSGSGNTVLEAALQEGHIDTVKVLLRAIGGPDYPQDSVALQVAICNSHIAFKALITTASIMYQHFQVKGTEKHAWLDWVLESGGNLVKKAAMTNLLHAAMFDHDLDLLQALFAHGCDPSQHLASGHTPLSFAIRYRKMDLIPILLDAGADPSKPANDPEGLKLTPLHQAVTALEDDGEKDTTIIDMLLKTGRCKISEGKKVASSLFAYLLREMNQENTGVAEILAFRMLESIKDVNTDRCDDGSTLMHAAVHYDRIDLVDILLEKGADINATNNIGQTPILLKCQRRKTTILPDLIERGADIFTKDNEGRSCLHMAADSNNINALELLLEKGMDMEERTSDGDTALICALAASAQGAALYLMDSGANQEVTCRSKSRNILHYAASLRLTRVVNRILSSTTTIDINARDSKQWTPLALACRKGSPMLIKQLIDAGADPETPEGVGDRPLHISLITGNEDVALLLLEHGVDISTAGSRGRTPLHLAVEYNNARATRFILDKTDNSGIHTPDDLSWTPLMLCQDRDIARLLLDRGADVNYADDDGWTALHQAVSFGTVSLYRLLLQRGADMNARSDDDGLSVGERMENIADLLLRERFREATSEELGIRRRMEVRTAMEEKCGVV